MYDVLNIEFTTFGTMTNEFKSEYGQSLIVLRGNIETHFADFCYAFFHKSSCNI